MGDFQPGATWEDRDTGSFRLHVLRLQSSPDSDFVSMVPACVPEVCFAPKSVK